ncbi:hypothetical protein GLV94_19040 [Virgibacillus halodenitrificans]|uniref:hypothetical protein n=1 Tax=Virgibacillus halodenitrificans TaxID=1482 RepID=UPI001369D65D|nr:hypothetical protein [Virgibacillus halodenitrificans]MYL47738.1 hypothetical protein [Virgibacillus halodenitrificans]
MRLISVTLMLLFIPLILTACTGSPGQNEGGYLSKKQVLKLSPDADIFEYKGKVYKSGVGWIEEKELTKGEQIGKISEEMANKLPTGAKVFAPKERKDILIVEDNGKEKRYLLQVGE